MSSNSFSLETNLEIQNPSVVCTIFSDKSKSLDLCKKQWIVSPLFLYLYFKIYILIFKNMSYHSGSVGKESACNAGDLDSMPGLERFPWRRTWQPTSVFLPGESPGTEKPGGCSSWDGKELDMIEQLSIQHSTITTTTKILAKSITTTTEILAKSNLKQNGELQDLRIPSRRGWFSC